jgi:hypothetical protein
MQTKRAGQLGKILLGTGLGAGASGIENATLLDDADPKLKGINLVLGAIAGGLIGQGGKARLAGLLGIPTKQMALFGVNSADKFVDLQIPKARLDVEAAGLNRDAAKAQMYGLLGLGGAGLGYLGYKVYDKYRDAKKKKERQQELRDNPRPQRGPSRLKIEIPAGKLDNDFYNALARGLVIDNPNDQSKIIPIEAQKVASKLDSLPIVAYAGFKYASGGSGFGMPYRASGKNPFTAARDAAQKGMMEDPNAPQAILPGSMLKRPRNPDEAPADMTGELEGQLGQLTEEHTGLQQEFAKAQEQMQGELAKAKQEADKLKAEAQAAKQEAELAKAQAQLAQQEARSKMEIMTLREQTSRPAAAHHLLNTQVDHLAKRVHNLSSKFASKLDIGLGYYNHKMANIAAPDTVLSALAGGPGTPPAERKPTVADIMTAPSNVFSNKAPDNPRIGYELAQNQRTVNALPDWVRVPFHLANNFTRMWQPDPRRYQVGYDGDTLANMTWQQQFWKHMDNPNNIKKVIG